MQHCLLTRSEARVRTPLCPFMNALHLERNVTGPRTHPRAQMLLPAPARRTTRPPIHPPAAAVQVLTRAHPQSQSSAFRIYPTVTSGQDDQRRSATAHVSHIPEMNGEGGIVELSDEERTTVVQCGPANSSPVKTQHTAVKSTEQQPYKWITRANRSGYWRAKIWSRGAQHSAGTP
jgi:hypothetical protein